MRFEKSPPWAPARNGGRYVRVAVAACPAMEGARTAVSVAAARTAARARVLFIMSLLRMPRAREHVAQDLPAGPEPVGGVGPLGGAGPRGPGLGDERVVEAVHVVAPD